MKPHTIHAFNRRYFKAANNETAKSHLLVLFDISAVRIQVFWQLQKQLTSSEICSHHVSSGHFFQPQTKFSFKYKSGPRRKNERPSQFFPIDAMTGQQLVSLIL